MLTKYSNPELLELPDCSALTGSGRCKRRSEPCIGCGCAPISRGDTRVRACSRLRTLPETAQAHISAKYYNGRRPWMEAQNV